jgi:hypothetical protein
MWLRHCNSAMEPMSKNGKPVKDDYFFTILFNYYLIYYYSDALAACFQSQTHSEQVSTVFDFVSYFNSITIAVRKVLRRC